MFGNMWFGYLVMLLVGIGLIARLFRDVVEQHRLTEAQQRFRAIIDEATDAIRIIDPDTLRILDVNHADCELSGYARRELIGRDVREFWAESGPGRVEREAALRETRAKGFARTLGVAYRRRSGDLLSVDATHRIVAYRERRYEIVIYRDASERLAAETARRESAELRSITLLARAVAHEINNPLAVILGAAQLLAGRLTAGTVEARWLQQTLEATGRIRDAVWRLNHMTRVVSTDEPDGMPGMLDTARSTAPPTGASAPPTGASEHPTGASEHPTGASEHPSVTETAEGAEAPGTTRGPPSAPPPA
jgi:PAS domain S-box-containing protein